MTRFACCATVAATVFSAVMLSGCVSSEGTGSGGGKSTEGPQTSFAPIDTNKANPAVKTADKGKSASAQGKRTTRKTTKFTAKQDTVKASLVRVNKSPAHPLPKIERPENPAFTVQIGAFLSPNNALRNQKDAKSRFPKYPVFSTFDAQSKFYRISVGKFMTRGDALDARREILKKYPKDYSACWVNYIPK